MLLAENWCLKFEDKVYGPYTSGQLKKFAQTGRLAAWSLISPAGANRWRKAQEEPSFSNLFGREDASQDKNFGKRSELQNTNAKNDKANAKNDKANAKNQSGESNFILIFDVVSAAASRVETAIMSLGPGFRIADNVWTVCCRHTAIGVRNAIAPYLLPRESIFIIDATRGRSSWQNYPPEIHAKLTAAWVKTKK